MSGLPGALIRYGLPGCSAPCADLTGFPANGAFYFQAFSGSVALPAAGYNYNSDWTPCMGRFLSRGCPQGSYPLSRPSVSLFDLAAVSSSRPTPRVAGARRSGQRLAAIWRPPTGLALNGSEHASTLAAVGMTRSRGARVWCTNVRATSLYAVGPETPDHDA